MIDHTFIFNLQNELKGSGLKVVVKSDERFIIRDERETIGDYLCNDKGLIYDSYINPYAKNKTARLVHEAFRKA
jgi:hypothetical protein